MKHDLSQLSESPGCYIFKDRDNSIIYVGKAKNLKKRVTSYFQKTDQSPKTKVLVSKITYIDTIITKNEIEALLLENNLIKKHKPKYNIELKDSKTYAYIEQTNEIFPRLKTYRSTKRDNTKILYGPFTSGKARDDIIHIVNKTFKLRTCRTLPKRACLRYSLGICTAPCIKEISKEEYDENLREAIRVIKGDIFQVIRSLEDKMNKASKTQEFERALQYKNQINSLEYLQEKQTVERKRTFNEDIVNYVIKNKKVYLMVFNIYKGTLNNKQEFVFNDTEYPLEQFIKQYYIENEVPKEIILPEEVDPAIQTYLTKKKKQTVKITIPKQGDKRTLLDLVQKNIEVSFFGELEKIEFLKRTLSLPEAPHVIECFDISHLSGTNIVASMVQFRNGRPDKSNYRRFKLKTVTQNDDFASMKEVVKRRYKHLKSNNLPLPDLIVIDGGKGQLSAAIEALKEVGVTAPIISLAKKFEEIYVPGNKNPIQLSEKNKGRLLLQQIRDEAHRFAIKYNRLLRDKERFS